MNMKTLGIAAVALMFLSACAERPGQAPDAADAPAAEAATPDAAPAAVRQVPRHDPAVFNFEGFGPAKFGTDEEQVRMAWGRPMQAGTPVEGASCYYLVNDPLPAEGHDVAFMFEGGGLRRYDVDVPRHVAPGDLVVGMQAAAVEAAFPGRVEAQPHKYIEGGQTLVVTPEDSGEARLVFESDAAGRITQWRIGLPPQIHYLEGCG